MPGAEVEWRHDRRAGRPAGGADDLTGSILAGGVRLIWKHASDHQDNVIFANNSWSAVTC